MFSTAVGPMSEPQEDEPYDVSKSREVPHRTKWKKTRLQLDQSVKCSRQEIGIEAHANAFVIGNSVPADCLEKVLVTKTEEILLQKIHLSLRLARRIVLKSAWQVQNESKVQHEG